MSPLSLGLTIAGGVILLVGTILGLVFGIVGSVLRKRHARYRAELEQEGIVLDSGTRRGTVRYRNYRAPGFYASRSFSSAACRLVLTRSHFAILRGGLLRIPFSELARYAVASHDGKLSIVTDNPIGATGHMDLRLAVDDPDAWVRALRERGATA